MCRTLSALLALAALAVARGGDDAAAPPRLEPEKLTELLDQLDSPEAPRRSAAAEALGKAKAAAAIPKLYAMLDDPDDDAQWKATVALGALGEPAIPRLIDGLNLEKERPRWKAETALKMMGKAAVPGLVEALRDRRGRVRQSAAYLLGEIADPAAIEPLAASMADKDEDTRWKAATSLTKFGNQATRAVLEQLQSESIECRRCAAWVFQNTLDPDAVPSLLAALRDADEQVRWKAAIALQKMGPAASDRLFAVLRTSGRADEKKLIAWVLEGVADPRVAAQFREFQARQAVQEPQAPPRPRPAVLPKSVALTLESAPDKATVFIDDKYVGLTPLTVPDLVPGHHFVKLTKRDHLPWTKLVELLYPEEKLEARLALKPKGTLLITSEPAQADVYIDGEYEGKTPLEKKNLDANPYSVRVEKEQFLPWEGEIEVRAGEQARAQATLKSKVEGWYRERLRENPNDVSAHTELAHYCLVRGELDKAVAALAAGVEVMAHGADTSSYGGRLAQEIAKVWGQAFQFGGGLQLDAVRNALHAALHGVWQRNKESKPLQRFLAELRQSVPADFTQPPR
ncbi:MAG TPA: PEGA domain-containing protein [Planctomycetota bacterium]|nr:PEGA domain-containing protein [Planctomycetota bacterium]HRR82828.1 PEGA domain-containing protein [Planctomycetota bacterium]HRT92944.1 PEGA domain-containing protein [Planctomycetota bacterium]